MRRLVHRLLCRFGICTSPSHRWMKYGDKMMKDISRDIRARRGPDGKYREMPYPPKPPKGPGGGSR